MVKAKEETPTRIKILERERTERQRREGRAVAKAREETQTRVKILERERTERQRKEGRAVVKAKEETPTRPVLTSSLIYPCFS